MANGVKVYKVQIEESGQSVCGPLEFALTWIKEAEIGDKYIITVDEMPKEEFENLEEFIGF